mmetsp:Transcript_813/g.2285  ORF Transcript_813/g.2285 Transcript_813/m.2285 type:complete len:282 (-) Transcript_813:198-1043(-)
MTPTSAAAESPKDLDTASPRLHSVGPHTRGGPHALPRSSNGHTRPPAASILARSAGASGLWSTVSARAARPLSLSTAGSAPNASAACAVASESPPGVTGMTPSRLYPSTVRESPTLATCIMPSEMKTHVAVAPLISTSRPDAGSTSRLCVSANALRSASSGSVRRHFWEARHCGRASITKCATRLPLGPWPSSTAAKTVPSCSAKGSWRIQPSWFSGRAPASEVTPHFVSTSGSEPLRASVRFTFSSAPDSESRSELLTLTARLLRRASSSVNCRPGDFSL